MRRPRRLIRRRAYTLVEILTATALMLIIMVAVTAVFASVTESIGQSRATLEMSQRLRAAAAILKQDLENVTAVMSPPLHPRSNKGYFQYVEGPIGPVIDPSAVAWNSEQLVPDTLVGDIDDMLLFTVTSKGEPYTGLVGGSPSTSNSAEIIYFIRGRTLYRRVLLIRPELSVRETDPHGFYAWNDVSVRQSWDHQTVPPNTSSGAHRPVLAANSLADLTCPENRTFQQPDLRAWGFTISGTSLPAPHQRPTLTAGITTNTKIEKSAATRYLYEPKPFIFFLRPWLGAPYDADLAKPTIDFKWVPGLGLPILAECSDPDWMAGSMPPTENGSTIDFSDPSKLQMPQFNSPIVPIAPYDALRNEHPWDNVEPLTGAVRTQIMDPWTNDLVYIGDNATRIGDDVLLTNVIGFDVKAWDPNAPILSVNVPDAIDPTITRQVALLPGDPGYVAAVINLQALIKGGSTPSVPTGAFADLNYMARVPLDATTTGYIYPDVSSYPPVPWFHRQGNPLYADSSNIPLASNASLAYGTRWQFAVTQQPFCFFPSVYDTWSIQYEYNRQSINYYSPNPTESTPAVVTVGNEDGDATYDEGTDSYDNDSVNGVDDMGERETQPPYNVPLQGIQIRIRVVEPGSSQVREVTLVQKFRTK